MLTTSSDLPDLQFIFKNEPIDSLAVNDIGIYNSGTDSIPASNIASANPITVVISKSVELYASELTYVSREVCGVVVSNRNNEISISFEYLDPGDGCVLRLFHSVPAKGDPAVTVQGSVQGGGDVVSGGSPITTASGWGTALMAGFIVATPIVAWIFAPEIRLESLWYRIPFTVAGFFVGISIVLIIVIAYEYIFDDPKPKTNPIPEYLSSQIGFTGPPSKEQSHRLTTLLNPMSPLAGPTAPEHNHQRREKEHD